MVYQGQPQLIISGLIKKKYILGKAYIVNEEDSIICIGAANVDRKFYCDTDLQSMTSNPVKSTKSIGGVARNIAENLGDLVKMLHFNSSWKFHNLYWSC